MGILRPFKRLLRKRLRKSYQVVSIVRMEGVIASGRASLRSSNINLSNLDAPLKRAFNMPDICAVALAINSPGGSPVQSSLIAKRVRSLADEKGVPVFAFAEDVAASGGYWLACSADEIYADPSSILGSIGVIFSGFGFHNLIEKYGIERRVYSAGENKGALDPFQAEKAEDIDRLKSVQKIIHDSFKELVRSRRSDKIKESDEVLFSGEFWTGAQAKELGLIDGIGDLNSIIRERFGNNVKFKEIPLRKSWLKDRFGIGSVANFKGYNNHDTIIDCAIQTIEERLIWSRFGL